MRSSFIVAAILWLAMLAGGCLMPPAPSPPPVHPANSPIAAAQVEQQELRLLGQAAAREVLSGSFLLLHPSNTCMVLVGIQNQTGLALPKGETELALQSSLRQSLRVQCLDETRRDELLRSRGFTADTCPTEVKTEISRQLGAHYMLTGSLSLSQQTPGAEFRSPPRQATFYQLVVEATDVATELVVWQKVIVLPRPGASSPAPP